MYSHGIQVSWLHAPLRAFLNVNLNGVTATLQRNPLAAMYIGALAPWMAPLRLSWPSAMVSWESILLAYQVWLSALKLFSSPSSKR